MRQDNSRGQTGMRRTARTGRTGNIPTVGVARMGADQGPASSGWSSGEHTARVRRSVQRGWRRLGFRRQFLMLVVAATLLSTLGTVGAAYLGARVAAISNAQSRIRRDLQVAAQVVGAHGDAVTLQAGQLFTADGLRLNSDDTVVGQMTTLTGDSAALYQLESGQLVGIAGNLTVGRPGAAIGQPLAQPAAQALLAGCAGSQQAPCHVTYSGVITIQETSYIAGFAPLDDGQGHLVGAMGVVTPLAAIDTPLRQLAGWLLLVGLLLTGVFIVVGYRISGPVSRRACSQLSLGLDDVSAAAGRLERMSRRQTARSDHQVAAAQDIVAELRKLSDLAEALEHGTNLLRESTGQMWAEMSYPAPAAPGSPAAPGIPAGSPAMRQTAVAASQIGAAAGQTRALCHGLRTQLNQIIAEAGLLSSESQEADAHIESLAGAVRRVEEALDTHPTSAGGGSTGDGVWKRLLFWRAATVLEGRSLGHVEDDDQLDRGMTWSTQALRADDGTARWLGRAPTDRISYAPRPARTSHTGPYLSVRSTGAFHATPHHAVPSGPRASGSHPATSGRRRVPWYSDEQDLLGAYQEADGHSLPDGRDGPSIPPQQSDNWRNSPSGPQSGPRPGNWMNDRR